MHVISFLTIVIVLIALASQYFVAGSVSGPDDIGEIWVSEPVVFDVYEQPIRTIEVGENSTIIVSVTNNLEIWQSFVLVIEARDGQGVTMFLTLVDWSMIGGGNYTSELVWTPTEPCAGDPTECSSLHQVRAFAISNLTSPEMLSHVSTFHDVTVVPHEESIPLILEQSEYEIEYSLPRGDIQAISADPGLHTITIVFQRVVADTSLSVSFPKVLLDKIFPPEIVPPGEGHLNILEIFVDGIPVEPRGSRETSENLTWVILIPRNSEEMEFTISLLP